MHGQPHQEVALFPRQPAQPFAFAADHQRQRAVEPRLGEGGRSRFAVQPGHPDVPLLQFFDGAVEIGHLGHAQMLDCAGAGIAHGRGDARGAAIRDDDAVHPHGLGGADQRAQVLGVLQMVEDEQQRRFAGAFGRCQTLVQIDIRIIVAFQRHALAVDLLHPQLVKDAAAQVAHRRRPGLRRGQDVGHDARGAAVFVAFQPESIEAAASGAQRF